MLGERIRVDRRAAVGSEEVVVGFCVTLLREDGRLLYLPAAAGLLSQLDHHVFRRDGAQTVQLDPSDMGIDYLEHPAIAFRRAWRIFYLTGKPALGILLKGHFSILGVAALHHALHLLSGMGDVLRNAASRNIRGDGDRLCSGDFLAACPITIAYRDFVFLFVDLLDARHGRFHLPLRWQQQHTAPTAASREKQLGQ